MITEAIILAGGFGTRLQETIPDLPKCLAPVAGRPFVSFVIDALRMQGIRKIIFSLGYKSEIVERYLKDNYPTLDYKTTIETTPLGTGGAIILALKQCTTDHIVVVNGDTLFQFNLNHLAKRYFEKNAVCAIVLKPMNDTDRYGVVITDEDSRVISFSEKQVGTKGLINGGVYLLKKNAFLSEDFPQSFSFEKKYLEIFFTRDRIYGSVQDAYFIDIGIPSDYQKASTDLVHQALDLQKIDTSWTLFLDRDGVINEERLGEYVLHWGQFIFSKGVLAIFQKLSQIFSRIIIVSNQRGVGKGLMKEETLHQIHHEMRREVLMVNGKIDNIYYCIDQEDTAYFRKPNPGMAWRATQDFPGIDINKCIMVGNKPSDMRFGRFAGMFTVFVKTTNPEQVFPHGDIDLIFQNLHEFATAL